MRKDQLKIGVLVWASTSTWGDYVGEVMEWKGSPARVTYRVVKVAKPPISTTMTPRYPFNAGSQHDVGITNVHPLDELKPQLGRWRRGGYKGLITDVEFEEVSHVRQKKENSIRRARNGSRTTTTKIVDVVEFVDIAMKYRARMVKIHVWLKHVSNLLIHKDTWEYMRWEPSHINPPFTLYIYQVMKDADRANPHARERKGNEYHLTAPSFTKIEAYFSPALPDGTTMLVLDPTVKP